jgi:hypothetical protein
MNRYTVSWHFVLAVVMACLGVCALRKQRPSLKSSFLTCYAHLKRSRGSALLNERSLTA